MATRSTTRALTSSVIGLALVLAVAAPVAATQYERERYSWAADGSYECGEDNWIDWQAEGSGVFSLRAGTGPDEGAFFGHDNYHWDSIDTRRSDGLALLASGDGDFKETRATRIDGGVFQFWAVNAGTYVVRDGDGKVLARDRGSFSESIIFDTLGDDVPGGVFIEQVSFRVNGPHSGGIDYCEYFG
jgi:hypothetical protein